MRATTLPRCLAVTVRVAKDRPSKGLSTVYLGCDGCNNGEALGAGEERRREVGRHRRDNRREAVIR